MIVCCEDLAKEQKLESIKQLPQSEKQKFEAKFCYDFPTVVRWAERKAIFSEFVAKSRLGKYGLRPCGQRGKNMFATSGMGARVMKHHFDKKPCLARPLAGVYARMKSWLKRERIHGHEVRVKILTQRLIFELEYERDQQLVLQEHNSEHFFPPRSSPAARSLPSYESLPQANAKRNGSSPMSFLISRQAKRTG